MYPITTVDDDSDDMKIYEFDRDTSMDWTWIVACGWTAPGDRFGVHDEVLAA